MENHHSAYLLPVWTFIKYIAISVFVGFIVGEVSRHTHADYMLALALWHVLFEMYWYVTLPAFSLMVIIAYVFRKKKVVKT